MPAYRRLAITYGTPDRFLRGWLLRPEMPLPVAAEEGIELLKPAPNDLLQKWPVSKRVNSSRADDDDPTLIEKVELTAAS